MGKVMTNLTMSLDGFIAGPQDDVQQLFKWYSSGTTEFQVQGGRMVLKVSPQSAELIEDSLKTTGAMPTPTINSKISLSKLLAKYVKLKSKGTSPFHPSRIYQNAATSLDEWLPNTSFPKNKESKLLATYPQIASMASNIKVSRI